MTLEGHIENGAIVLTPPVNLPDGTRVRVEVLPAESPQPSLFDRFGALAGKATHLPADAAAQHDHYLYGTPKSS